MSRTSPTPVFLRLLPLLLTGTTLAAGRFPAPKAPTGAPPCAA